MKKFLFLMLAALFTVSCNQLPAPVQANEMEEVEIIKDGVFIHITEAYNNPHKVLMPLQMATMMAKDKDVLVYMDIEAVNLLTREARDMELKGFESLHTYLTQLLDLEVDIFACPTCLKAAGYIPEDLRLGIQIANKERFFNFTQGRILTFDY